MESIRYGRGGGRINAPGHPFGGKQWSLKMKLRELSEYTIWRGMIHRCHAPHSTGFRHYGGRGIIVCDRWRESFCAFIEDMGFRSSPELSIDRINNDGNYEPGNCRWATRAQQARNRRRPKHRAPEQRLSPRGRRVAALVRELKESNRRAAA